jgi:hypothetical protein
MRGYNVEHQILLSAEYEFFLHVRVIVITEILQQCMLSYRFDESADGGKK